MLAASASMSSPCDLVAARASNCLSSGDGDEGGIVWML